MYGLPRAAARQSWQNWRGLGFPLGSFHIGLWYFIARCWLFALFLLLNASFGLFNQRDPLTIRIGEHEQRWDGLASPIKLVYDARLRQPLISRLAFLALVAAKVDLTRLVLLGRHYRLRLIATEVTATSKLDPIFVLQKRFVKTIVPSDMPRSQL